MIAELEQRAANERDSRPVQASNASVAVPDRVANLRVEIEQLRNRLEQRKADDERLKATLASYSARLEAAPKLESDLTELMRDYTTIQSQYQALLQKSEDSKIAVNLERRQIGEQFKILDGARLPERPFYPDRPRMNVIGFVSGIAFGLALIALLEYRDTTLKTDDDVVTSLALPVMAVIPAMVTASDRRRMKRRRALVAISASLVAVVAAAAVAAWRFRLLDSWIR
jgi:uncharacterized protein involved in exopolysaccharide biosynthesis